jgi:hypothetical protein
VGQVVERVRGRALVGGDEAPPVDAEHRRPAWKSNFGQAIDVDVTHFLISTRSSTGPGRRPRIS